MRNSNRGKAVEDSPVKVLLLSKYGRMGASSRVRSYQYLSGLEQLGINVVASPLFDDGYLRDLYSGNRRSIKRISVAYLRRALQVAAARNYDLWWIENEIFPWLPAVCDLVSQYARKPYIADYDDAIFHFHFADRRPFVTNWRSRKIRSVMRRAAAVISANRYLTDCAVEAKARRVMQLPSAVDVTRYGPVPSRHDGVFRIGWIGTPVTAPFLKAVKPALLELGRIHPVQFVAIGLRTLDLGGVPTEARPWTEETEVRDIQTLDVGIMPVPDSNLAKGKSGYKLIQYMGCGLPVVASPVGANIDIVNNGINGFLASSVGEWISALDTLAKNPAMRTEMGRSGRQKIEDHFSVQALTPALAELLRSVALESHLARDASN